MTTDAEYEGADAAGRPAPASAALPVIEGAAAADATIGPSMNVSAAVTRLAREESGRVLALLAARFGLDLADDAVQDALIEALSWREVPTNPAAWLYTVARNRAIDRLRRESAARRRELSAATDLARLTPVHTTDREEEPDMIIDGDALGPGTGDGDEQLRLMLLCCHPALAREAQIALTLRLVGGLTTTEVAAALLVPEGTLAQRIVRAKRKVRDAGIPLSIPDRLDERVDALLGVLSLVFNEGYLARGGTAGARVDLMAEAIRLTRRLHEQLPENGEVRALLALELFTAARTAARFAEGRIVLLADQDRALWDRMLIARAEAELVAVLRAGGAPGPFGLQAAIARCHAVAGSDADTDWPLIATLYARLETIASSPVVTINRAVAVARAEDPEAGLAVLDAVMGHPSVQDYHLLWSTRAELLREAGRHDEASEAFRRARALVVNPAEAQHLDGRIAAL